MAVYFVPSKSRSGGGVYFTTTVEEVAKPVVYEGPRNARSYYERYDYLERLEFSLVKKWRRNPYEAQYKLRYFAENGAIWFDSHEWTWRQVPYQLFQQVIDKTWAEYYAHVKRGEKRYKNKLRKSNKIYVNIADYPQDEDLNIDLDSCDSEFDDEVIPPHYRKSTARVFHAEMWPEDHIYEQEWDLVRNPNLLARLRARIWMFAFLRKPLKYVRRLMSNIKEGQKEESVPLFRRYATPYGGRASQAYECVEHQMDSAHGESEATIKTSNVVLGETEVESTVNEGFPIISWGAMSSSEPFDQGYDRILDRFTLVDAFTWDISYGLNTVLHSQIYPAFAINKLCSGSRGNVPFCVPFNIYRYWSGDIELKVQVNSNKFQVGQLQVSWYYYSEAPGTRSDVFTSSQLPHCLVSAGASNEATLMIPYKHWRPLLHTKERKGYVSPLNLGMLRILVLSPLAISPQAKTPRTCGGSIFIRLINSRFTGLVDGGLSAVSTQMLSASNLASMASKVLKLANCDNPSSTATVNYLVPTASHSWCAGTGTTEVLQNLRLDYRCLGVNRGPDMTFSESSISYIVSHYGLMKPFLWDSVDSSNNMFGKLLYDMNVHPIVDKNKLYSWSRGNNKLDDYSVPPVGVISSMFMYWRGSLELRFDIIASAFHTGRLLIAYVPGLSGNQTVTIEQARNSTHAVFSLQESQSFTFVVPYIADKPWWHRRYAGPQKRHEISAPSKLFIFVLNPLIPMEQVSSSVYILPYIRGGSDFEVAVPVQPALGLNDNVEVNIASDYLVTNVDGYAPVYIGTWHSFAGGTKAILRYGSVSEHVAQFQKPLVPAPLDTYAVYTCVNDSLYVNGIMPPYYVMWSLDSYNYIFPVETMEKAKIVSRGLSQGKDPVTLLSKLITVVNPGSYGTQSKIFFQPEYFQLEESFTNLVPQSDERMVNTNILSPSSTLPGTSYGQAFFNENFGDLKDLCRRYLLLYTGTLTFDNQGLNGKACALFKFPACPTGLNLITSGKNMIWNLMREGHIPLICSGFRYFRGSLRYKLVMPADFNCNVWVQHHPDKPLDGDRVLAIPDKYNAADSVRNHSYAYYVQSTRVNNILEFEIPCYISGNFVIMGRRSTDLLTDASDFYSLGEVVVGLESVDTAKRNLTFSLYYSVGDDASFNVFTGFTPKVFCDEAYAFVEPQMFAIAQGFLGNMVGAGAYRLAAGGAAGVKKAAVDVLVTAATPVMEKAVGPVENVTHVLEKEMHNWMQNVGMTMAITQLCHVLANPSIKTLAISIVSILMIMCQATASAVFSIMMNMQEVFIALISRYWKTIVGRASDHQVDPQQQAFEFQSDFIEDLTKKDIFSIGACIFTLWSSCMGITCAPPGSYPNFMRGVSSHVSLVNNVATLLKNLGDTVVYVVRHLLGCTNEKTRLEMIADSNVVELKEWVLEVNRLLDPRMMNRLLRNQTYSNRVFDACLYGSILITEDLHKTCPRPRVLLDSYKELCKLRDKIIQMGNHPDVRFECFVVWMAGHRGIGKSFITDKICAEMLQSINYQTEEAMIYWLTSTTKYWNGVRNPPVIARDDAFNLDGTLMEEELGNYFMIKSSSVLNPNMAAVEDKNKRLNPLIFFLNSNFTFPTIPQAKMPEAVYRRRQALIEASFTDEIIARYGAGDPHNIASAEDLPPEEKEGFKHLKFRWSRNPAVNREEFWSPWLTYGELMQWLLPKFAESYRREQLNFQRRIQTAYCLSPQGEAFDLPELLPNQSLRERVEMAKRQAGDRLQNIQTSSAEVGTIRDHLQRWGEKLNDYWASRPEHQNSEPKPGCSFWADENINSVPAPNYEDDVRKELFYHVLNGNTESEDRHRPNTEPFWKAWAKTTHLHDSTIKILLGNISELEVTNDQLAQAFVPATTLDIFYPYYYPMIIWRADFRVLVSCAGHAALEPLNIRPIGALHELDQCMQYWRLAAYRDIHNNIEMLRPENPDVANDCPDMPEAARIYVAKQHAMRLNPNAVCQVAQFFVEHLTQCADIQYCPRREKFIFKNVMGFTVDIDAKCTCPRCVFRNPLLNNLIQYVWDSTHPDQHFNFSSMDGQRLVHTEWGDWIKELAQCAWQHYLKPGFSYLLQWIIDCLPRILTMLASCAILCGIRFAKNYFFGSEESFENESGRNYFKFDSPRFKNSQQQSNKSFEAQNTESRNVLINIIENNTVILTCTYVRDNVRYDNHGRCLIIRGRSLLVLRHYYEEHKNALQYEPVFMLHYNVGGKQTFREVTFDDVYGTMKRAIADGGNGDSNYCLCELPKFMPQFKSIIRHFATVSQHNNLSRTMDLMITGDSLVRDLEFTRSGKFIVTSNGNASDVRMENAYTYNKQGRGMCGSLLVCHSVNGGNGAIIGMHVAGSPASGKGVAEPLFREMFDVYIENVVYPVVEDYQFEPVGEKPPLTSNLLLLGKVPAEHAHHESGKSKILPSLIAGNVYPVRTQVNPLRPNDPRQPPGSHPLIDGCQKHGTGILTPLPKEIMLAVEEDLSDTMYSRVLPVRNSISPLTEQQAICGDVDVKHFEALNWTSSEGFPLSSYRPKGAYNKKWLFKLREDSSGYILEGLHPLLRQMLDNRREAYGKNIVPITVYTDCLKDYRLSPEKCKIPGKTRIFSISPVQTTIDIKVYLGDFMASYKDNFIKAEHAIGINPDSLDWTTVVHYLSEVGGNIVTGDYSNFGPCLNSEFVAIAAKSIRNWLEKNGAAPNHVDYAYNMICEEIINPVHLCGDIVYQTLNGIASGSAMTGEINSEVNKGYLRAVYLLIMKDKCVKYASMRYFRQYVRVLVYGDDFIMSVNDEIIEYFNLHTIIEYFGKMNITVTSASKDDNCPKFTSLEQATFLKRGFKKHPFRANIVLAPVDKQSVEECVNWVHKSNDPAEALKEVCRASMDLAYGHGPEYYRAHGDRLVKACREQNVLFEYVSWNDRDREVFDCSVANASGVSLKIKVPAYMREE